MSDRLVDPDEWHAAVETALADGFGFLDWLGGVDQLGRSDAVRVVLVLRHLERPAETRQLASEVPRVDGRLPSIGDLLAGASWHERETAELLGVEFVGGDRRRLLLDPGYEGAPPLRKDQVLAARAATTWPGGKEPGESAASPSRRRMAPPGVPDPQVWGDRTEPGAAEATEVAASLAGGRVRRRDR